MVKIIQLLHQFKAKEKKKVYRSGVIQLVMKLLIGK